MAKNSTGKGSKKSTVFHVGKVRAYLRGRVWYLCYRENGRRRQPRIGIDRDEARQMAAEINAQLEVGVPSSLGFEPISISDLRERWLIQHEHVRRSSLATIRRYRTASEYLLQFVCSICPLKRVSDFRPTHAEEFARYLRRIKVASNGHQNARKRPLRDSGVKYILETCSALFNYAQRHRHLSPYSENPFRVIEAAKIPIEDAKPISVFDVDLEERFLSSCDDWQFPIFLTLLQTGLRPGELQHLLLPNDLDLENHWLYVRNKPRLGWKIKTRTERDIPITPVLSAVLLRMIGKRTTGPVFVQRRCSENHEPPLLLHSIAQLEKECAKRQVQLSQHVFDENTRELNERVAKSIWRDLGAVKTDWIRVEFIRVMKMISMPEISAPKSLRHTFATCLQDANVDPLIRNQLLGHSPGGGNERGCGLGMTAVYTHTRPETKRKQLEHALAARPALKVAADWLCTQGE
jgi:integrase